MTDQTKATPDPLELGKTEEFVVTGLPHIPMTINKLEFTCWLFGAKVYDESFDTSNPTAVPGTVWTSSLPYPIPSVAPSTTYDIEIAGVDADGAKLFTITTAFKF